MGNFCRRLPPAEAEDVNPEINRIQWAWHPANIRDGLIFIPDSRLRIVNRARYVTMKAHCSVKLWRHLARMITVS